jgi:hypothetical protein
MIVRLLRQLSSSPCCSLICPTVQLQLDALLNHLDGHILCFVNLMFAPSNTINVRVQCRPFKLVTKYGKWWPRKHLPKIFLLTMGQRRDMHVGLRMVKWYLVIPPNGMVWYGMVWYRPQMVWYRRLTITIPFGALYARDYMRPIES